MYQKPLWINPNIDWTKLRIKGTRNKQCMDTQHEIEQIKAQLEILISTEA